MANGARKDARKSFCAECNILALGILLTAVPPSTSAPVESLSILIVEDNQELLFALGAMLRAVQHRVTTCTTFPSALATLEREHFDVVLTDMRLGEDDGVDIMRMARILLPESRIIAMTGANSCRGPAFQAKLGYEFGPLVVLQKPFNHDDLNAAIAGTLPFQR